MLVYRRNIFILVFFQTVTSVTTVEEATIQENVLEAADVRTFAEEVHQIVCRVSQAFSATKSLSLAAPKVNLNLHCKFLILFSFK